MNARSTKIPRHRARRAISLWLAALLLFLVSPPLSILHAQERPRSEDYVEQRIRTLSEDERRGGIVLVLSGGGTKGFAHIGVLKILERENIPIVGIVGTSIGSVMGGLYAVGYNADELHEIISSTNVMGLIADTGTKLKPDAGDHRPMGESATLYRRTMDKDFHRTGPMGIMQATSLVSFLTKYTGHLQTTDFNDLPIPFACVATDITTGRAVVMRHGNLASSIRASIAIPGLFEPVPLDNTLLVDGGLVANLPVAIAKEIFPGYPIVAVSLSGTSIEKPTERITNVVDVLMQTLDIMTVDQLKANEELADLVIYPDVNEFGMLDAVGYDTIYQRGYDAAEANEKRIVAISRKAPPPPIAPPEMRMPRMVRSVRVEGLHARAAWDIEKTYRHWVGHPYDVDQVNQAMDRLAKREEIATIDVDTYTAEGGAPNEIDVVFSVEKRAPYEFSVGGYTSNMHSHRWVSLMATGRDLAADGDSATLEGRVGDSEWGAALRYFTPLMNERQWGFSLGARKDEYTPHGMDTYSLERYSLRAMHYKENLNDRIGLGFAVENTNATGQDDKTAWGPYLYFNKDTLDNLLTPTRGYTFNTQVWWNTEDIWVSRTRLTAYMPLRSNVHFILNLGLETGDADHQAYRALLGDQEELFSLARHPYVGDQAAWAHLGIGRNFYSSWWGSLRGELFASYGLVMDDWNRTEDAWETGLAFKIPGQFMNAQVIFVYSDEQEFTVGFTLGNPQWWSSPLP